MGWLKRFLTPPLIILAALVMWCEEWLWARMAWLTGLVSRLPVFRWYDSFIARLPPYPTMVVFLLPTTLLFPIKLLAVYWFANGYFLAGSTLLIGAKVLGTAFVARTYVVCHPKLMTIRWFRRLHDWLIATRNLLYAAVRAMPIYQAVHTSLVALKHTVRRWMLVIQRKARRGLWTRWLAIRRWRRIRRSRN